MLKGRIDRRVTANFEWSILVCMLALSLIGLTVLYSAGFNQDLQKSMPMERQMTSMGLGIVAFFIAYIFNANFWRRWAWFFYIVGCLLLAYILFGGVVAGGARRWLDLGGFRMQPSEFMKVGIILVFARYFSEDRFSSDGLRFVDLIIPGILLILPVALTLKEPDLGTALVQFLVGGSIILISGLNRGTLVRLSAIGLLALIPAWFMLHDYQRMRILNFMHPERDPLGSGYHALQSKIAVGSGSIMGKGLLHGTQTQLRFLPEQTTDFIFSVLAEEWGFLGSMLCISIYGLLLYRIFKICSRTQDRFPTLVVFGVGSMFFWHVFFNIGMVTGVLPVVGVTLPLLSYGGSSVVTLMTALGLVAGVSSRRFLFS